MVARHHTAHRYRIAVRCERCKLPLIRACSYRNCAATITIDRRRARTHERECTYAIAVSFHRAMRVAETVTIDLVAAAYEIFGDLVIGTTLGLDAGDPIDDNSRSGSPIRQAKGKPK